MHRPAHPRRPARFNSAAPSQARRRLRRPGRAGDRAGASIRPRPLRRGDCEGANLPAGAVVASIRPRPLRRGDLRTATRPRGESTRFNSAAPSQARRPSVTPASPEKRREELQFGRALSGAETTSSEPARADGRPASIRPRPLRRGDPRTPSFVFAPWLLLQFGRALSGAETGGLTPALARAVQLQFGRALSGAETPTPCGVGAHPPTASIRPRPLRRGDAWP